MKINCSRCNREIRINRTQINQKLLQFYDKTKLYFCRSCRQRENIQFDAEATIRKLQEINPQTMLLIKK